MTHKDEKYILNTITENNIMLERIIQILNTYIANSSQENDNDFSRNVLANIVSEIFTSNKKRGQH